MTDFPASHRDLLDAQGFARSQRSHRRDTRRSPPSPTCMTTTGRSGSRSTRRARSSATCAPTPPATSSCSTSPTRSATWRSGAMRRSRMTPERCLPRRRAPSTARTSLRTTDPARTADRDGAPDHDQRGGPLRALSAPALWAPRGAYSVIVTVFSSVRPRFRPSRARGRRRSSSCRPTAAAHLAGRRR